MVKWIPWQLIAKRASKAYGFSNPLDTLDRVRRFSQPSETAEPIELLRAGFAFHSRGLVNTKAIQNNLDWVWPYWVTRQFDPKDVSFVPRAFSFSHINLTHRNWTAVGLPNSSAYGIVDPRGLVTPFHDSWSIDFWVVDDEGKVMFPSQLPDAEQALAIDELPCVRTRCERDDLRLQTIVRSTLAENGQERVEVVAQASCESGGYLVASLRPYNPEGIQFIDRIETDEERGEWRVNDSQTVRLIGDIEGYLVSNYEQGDVSHLIGDVVEKAPRIECSAGMATAAALSRIEPGRTCQLRVLASPERTIPVSDSKDVKRSERRANAIWAESMGRNARLELSDNRVKTLYDQACSTLVLLSPEDIYPGPYTYRRFWFRDACLIAHALLRIGQHEACRRALSRFPERQTLKGYYLSQEGEWDSNGQVLWIYEQYEQLAGEAIPEECYAGVRKAINWFNGMRVSAEGTRWHGLLPAGFSAEHFGPNDYYYWDDFWAIGGLEAAAQLCLRHGDENLAQKASNLAVDMRQSVEASIESNPVFHKRSSMPASPNRRMDSGAIGSLVSDYPLQLFDAGDVRVRRSVEWILENCFVDGAFFQDMIHSGLNVYLTLDVAQTLLRLGDRRWRGLLDRCAELASPTGQWPEAIHPITLGGCMGDGQHAWAAAEWVMLVRNAFVREEKGCLVLGSGVESDWLPEGKTASFGYTPTSVGDCRVSFERKGDRLEVSIDFRKENGTARWRLAVPGYENLKGVGSARAMASSVVEARETVANGASSRS
ncbi:hypothetical protein [Pelagicoccus sp. SDUM812003]|uniref:hypothetical protein n=1 Tax=Pelagicoccus sp. SDUM812003 TaxID=3041267 RepID=UPI00280D8EA7|nr:hypothetical protein [Pelagicoccus sp. SDUM812003]MDQ8204326.1 hypothetical protein [Pelagicoccus sp. SDUM812003]